MLTTSGKSVTAMVVAALLAMLAGGMPVRGQDAEDKPAPKADEMKSDEGKAESKPAEAKADEPKADEPKADKADEPKTGKAASKPGEAKGDEAKKAEPEDTGKPANAKELPVLWDDLLHYIKIARTDLALDHAKAVLDKKIEPRELYLLAKGRADAMEILTRGRGQRKDLSEAIGLIQETIATGFRNMRENVDEIAESIRLLGGNPREFKRGVERLQVSGEYAMPQLIQKMTDKLAPAGLADRIATVLPELGPGAVNALAAALGSPDVAVQQAAAQALGRLQYRHAAASLRELMDKKDVVPTTLRTARAAYLACMGGDSAALKKTTSELFYDLAERFYYRNESMLPDAQFDVGNVWSWDDKVGALSYVPVPREIFADVYAMRMARKALEHNPKFSPAVSLWLAAYIKKEADLPAGKVDKTQKEGAPTAWFYTLASSPQYVKEVAVRGIKDKDTPVLTMALKALAQTNGVDSILKPTASGEEPVVVALTYPDRRARFLAAVALADAMPRQRFGGAAQTMTVLNEALHQTGKKVAVLVVQNAEVRNKMKDAVRAAGWDVIDEPDVRKALLAARDSAGVDAFVIGELTTGGEIMPLLRKDPMFALTPVVMAAAGRSIADVAAADKRMVLIAPETAVTDVKDGLEKTLDLASGTPMPSAEARKWAVQAARCLHDLAVARNSLYDLQVCRKGLIDALDRTGQADVQTAVADALAVLAGPEAQRALVDVACKAGVAQAVRVAAFNAAAESVRRQGNLITEEQALRVIEVVNGKDALAVREAAAKLLGTLNLPSDKIKDLVLQDQR